LAYPTFVVETFVGSEYFMAGIVCNVFAEPLIDAFGLFQFGGTPFGDFFGNERVIVLGF
jgi:hypothetical protein